MKVEELESIALCDVLIDIFGRVINSKETTEYDDYEVRTIDIYKNELWITLGVKKK